MPALPADLTESALAEWLDENDKGIGSDPYTYLARAVRELVRDRVTEAVRICRRRDATMGDDTAESIVVAVMESK